MDTQSEQREHLYDILKDFDTAMLVTQTPDGGIHARPMAVAELSAESDAYFVTSMEAAKVAEITAQPLLTITFQSSNQFASVTGIGTVTRDQAQIDRLWNAGWEIWFPKGKSDPSVTLIKFQARDGEYWNNAGMQGVKYFFKVVKAYVAGEKPAMDDKLHAKVKL